MSLLALLHAACLGLVAILLVAAAAQDLRTMRIANGVSLAIAGLFAVWTVSALALGELPLSDVALDIGCGMAVFVVAATGFVAGALGGGDVKLLTAMSLFAGPAHLLDFFAITALVGGLLGLAVLAGAPIGRAAAADGATLRARLRSGLPYGPAIAAGGLWVVAALGLS